MSNSDKKSTIILIKRFIFQVMHMLVMSLSICILTGTSGG